MEKREAAAELWSRYLEARGPQERLAARNALAVRYLAYAGDVVRAVSARLPAIVAWQNAEEIRQDAALGLLAAIEAFDPSRGYQFRTYAQARIRGAVLDGIRERDLVPRVMRGRSSRAAAAAESLRQDLGREALADELRLRLGLSDREWAIWIAGGDLAAPATSSLDRAAFRDDAGEPQFESEFLPDAGAEPPWRRAQRAALREILLRGLSRKERLILMLYYEDEMTMKEIGATLGMSESRVSQVRSQVLARLSKLLRERGLDLARVGEELEAAGGTG